MTLTVFDMNESTSNIVTVKLLFELQFIDYSKKI